MSETFSQFFERRRDAAIAYAAGDGSLVNALVPHQGDATFHSPKGDTVTGSIEVARRYLADVKGFHPNGTSHLEILQMGEDGNLGFWTGFQIANVQIGDMLEPTQMRLRVTEIFRKSDSGWQMIHRHADTGAHKQE
jgi:ketosteroid isomerase-like protein